MPALPRVNQYYPNVPLSELSDLYSVGNNAFGSNRVCIVSYLPPTLRINSKFPLNNKYVLFVENTASVTSIAWTYKLYSKGLLSSNTTFLTMKNQDTPELDVFFMEDLLSGGNILFDRLQIICTVVNAGQTLTLTLEHNLVKALDVKESGLISDTQSMIFSGNPLTTNYIANNLKDYLSADTLLWCNAVTDLDGLGDNTLLKIVTAIIYYNIMVSRNNAPEPIKSQGIEKYAEKPGDFNILFNISEYCNTNIKALINDDTPYTYELRNGICGLPLNILNDVLPAINQMPDFTNISATNKILELMKSSVETAENENGSGVLQTTSQKIEDSRQRLITDASKFKELYNLSLFPKSAIKLTAILVKFLLECSKKNQCAECKDMQSTWKFITLDGLKDNQNLLNNVLTHYFVFPSSKVNYYATQATKITELTWQPTVYTILNQSPRIVKAYFAYKVVREMNTANEYEIDFVRIDSSMTRKDANGNALATQPDFDCVIGRDCYLIVETLGCRGQELTCNVRSRENYFTTQPAPQILSLVRRNAATENHLAIVGNYDDLRNPANVLPGTAAITEEYIKVNHKDKAILKMSLRPQTLASFDEWADGNSAGIAGLKEHTANLEITTNLSDEAYTFFGNIIIADATSAVFLSTTDPYDTNASFRVINRTVYEIYHIDNTYNNLGVASLIGRIKNSFVDNIANNTPNTPFRNVDYYYYDQLDNEHYFGVFNITKILRYPVDANNPNDWVSMVRAPHLAEYNTPPVHIRFLTDNSDRDYIDLNCFAGLLGAMAANNIADLGYNGFSNADGSPGGSRSHKNGLRGDLRYLRTAADGGACLLTDTGFDYNRQVEFNNSLHDYGWARTENMLSENFTRNNATTLLPNSSHYHKTAIGGITYNTRDQTTNLNFPQIVIAPLPNNATYQVGGLINQNDVGNPSVTRHNNHLHVQGYDQDFIINII